MALKNNTIEMKCSDCGDFEFVVDGERFTYGQIYHKIQDEGEPITIAFGMPLEIYFDAREVTETLYSLCRRLERVV